MNVAIYAVIGLPKVTVGDNTLMAFTIAAIVISSYIVTANFRAFMRVTKKAVIFWRSVAVRYSTRYLFLVIIVPVLLRCKIDIISRFFLIAATVILFRRFIIIASIFKDFFPSSLQFFVVGALEVV